MVQCEGWYPLAPIGLLFVFIGIAYALARPASFTDEEALSRQLYKEILAEYARGWVIFKLFVSVLLILTGAAALFSLQQLCVGNTPGWSFQHTAWIRSPGACLSDAERGEVTRCFSPIG